MRVGLMHPEQDFVPPPEVPRQRNFRDSDAGPAHAMSVPEAAAWVDLELDTLAGAMANGDRYLFDVARKAFVLGIGNDLETIRYRQEVLRDCLANAEVAREMHALVEETIEAKKKHYFGVLTRYPTGILRGAVELMRVLLDALRRLRRLADQHANRFESQGFKTLLGMLQREFSDDYLARVERHLAELKFRSGLLLSARLGENNESTGYVLRREPDRRPGWLKRFLHRAPRAYSFRLHERDEAGARILSELHDRGINLVANALAQSTEHVLSFFLVLRLELSFHIGCLNLHDRLVAIEAHVCFPRPEARGTRRLHFAGLRDPCLALQMDRAPVANDVGADGCDLVIITGANQGG
ncbi:MAG: MutS-related protein, partial [Casimicrobiaceae bacterium]